MWFHWWSSHDSCRLLHRCAEASLYRARSWRITEDADLPVPLALLLPDQVDSTATLASLWERAVENQDQVRWW